MNTDKDNLELLLLKFAQGAQTLAKTTVDAVNHLKSQPWFLGLVSIASLPDIQQKEMLRISLLKHLYIHDNHDPVYAWEALAIADEYDWTLPEWATTAIAARAQHVITIEPSNIDVELKKALLLDGNSAKKLGGLEKLLEVFFEIEDLIQEQGFSKTRAIKSVAKDRGYKETTLRDKFNSLDKLLSLGSLPEPFSKV